MARDELARVLSCLLERGQSARCCDDLAEFESRLFAELLPRKNSFRWFRFLLLRGTAESGALKANALPVEARRLAVRAVRQSDRDCLVAVCTRVRDLIALACFLSKDAVINSLRLLVARAAHLHVALQRGAASSPLRLDGPLVLDVLQLQVVHLVGTALLKIQIYSFW